MRGRLSTPWSATGRRIIALIAIVLLAGLSPAWRPALAESPAQPLIEPDAGRQPIIDLIGSARSSVDLAIYELSDRRIVTALGDAAGRGVRVRVLAEPLPGGHSVNARSLSELRQKGAQTQDSSPVFRLTHEKAVVVDGSVALIMSLNLVAATFEATRDFAILDSDPADVAEVEAVFEADWNRQTVAVSRPALVWSPDNARARILQTVLSATSEVDVYAEELLDREIIAALEGAAAGGVRVRLIMTDTGSRDSSRGGRARLAAAGGGVRLLPKPFVHAKVMIVDGIRAFVGSENFSASSLDRNRELGILTADAAIIAVLTTTFEQDWDRAVPERRLP